MARLKAAQFDDHMTLVEHLDELRSRIIFSGIVLLLAVVFCFWQNHEILRIANEPLPGDKVPITFSPTEPFFTTLKLSLYGGILLALPILLYQLYAYVLPAFSPGERRVVFPMLLAVPFLFIAGCVFAYFVVLPPALSFLLGFNADQFNIEIRGSEYYGFFVLTILGVGLLFQIPIAILAITRLGIVTPQQLAHNRGYAILVIAVVAMLLPGTDPITMLISMLPLYLLFEFSVLLARWQGRARDEADDEDDQGDEDDADGPDDDGPDDDGPDDEHHEADDTEPSPSVT